VKGIGSYLLSLNRRRLFGDILMKYKRLQETRIKPIVQL